MTKANKVPVIALCAISINLNISGSGRIAVAAEPTKASKTKLTRSAPRQTPAKKLPAVGKSGNTNGPRLSPSELELKNWDTKLGGALVLYRDGNAAAAEQQLKALFKSTQSNCRRRQVLGYLGVIKYRTGDVAQQAQKLLWQATADPTCPSQGSVFKAYEELLKEKGLSKELAAVEKLANKQTSIGSCEMKADGSLRLMFNIGATLLEVKQSDSEYLEYLGHIGPMRPGEGCWVPAWPD